MPTYLARTDRIKIWIEIALAIGILSILFASEILSKDMSGKENNNRSPVEQKEPR